ncbi:MAG TPA: hypothetical protein PLY93_06130 [Turneriella sp.]|nr:hypothetical protein [Turneriella sp.]
MVIGHLKYIFKVLFLLVLFNFTYSLFAANLESDYRDAVVLFEKRDVVSCEASIAVLEKILEQKTDSLDAQALIAYAYAHHGGMLQQINGSGGEYLNSAYAFAKAALSQQPTNIYARKAILLLKLIGGDIVDVRKQVEKEWSEKETDADIWYFRAVSGDAAAATKSLQEALRKNTSHVWIYSDMAFRALLANDFATAEKWIAALQKQQAEIADVDLLKAVLAIKRSDEKEARLAWDSFTRKAPESVIVDAYKKLKK